MSYDSDGNLASVTDPDGDTTTATYNAMGERLTEVRPRGNVAGNDPADFTTTWTRDPAGDPLTRTDPMGHTTTWTYDADHRRLTTTAPTSGTTMTSYDPDGRISSVSQPGGSCGAADRSHCLSYTYDPNGNQTSVSDGNANTTTYQYNARNQRTEIDDPLGRATTMAYDADGNLLSVQTPGGSCTSDPATGCTTYTYNPDNQIATIDYSGAPSPVSYAYDPDGRLTSMSDGTGSSTRTYDSMGDLVKSTNGAGATVTNTYDADQNRTAITYPDSTTVRCTYDTADRMQTLTDANANKTSFGYNPDGALSTVTYPNGVTETTSYDHDGGPSALSDTTATTTLAAYSYTRNDDQQLTGAAASGASAGPSETYGYNPRQQLTDYTTGQTPTSGYGYDGAENPTTLPDGNTLTYDAADQLTNQTGTPATSYGYNQRGDRTSTTTGTETTSYTYNQANQLTSYAQGTTTETATYDGNGLLATTHPSTGSATTNTWDLRDPTEPLLLTDGSTDYLYGPANLPIEQTKNQTPTYLQHDQQGSTRLLTNATGVVTATYTYTPYGAPTHTGTTITTLLYDAQIYDPTTGLYYLRNRYYDPATTQFLTVDPAVTLTHAPYTYANDDPLDEIDPTGLSWWNPTSWSGKTWETIGGVTLGVVAAGTGVGAIVEGATAAGLALGVGSVALGGGAAALDYGPCVQGDDAAACAGLGLGTTGALAGAVGLGGAALIGAGVIGEDSLAAGIIGGVGAFGWQIGVAGTAVDLAASFAGADPCPSGH